MNAPYHGPARAELDVAIMGAGFSGLCMAIALKKAGQTNFRIFEKAHDLGGTWRDNRYPGCACDVPSHLYSFSFEQNPDWSRSYSPQAEIWRYMKACADKYDLTSHIRYGAAVTDAAFDEARHVWRIKLANGETTTARALVSGVGALHLPAYPKIKGLESFAGHSFHSSEWDESADLTGQRVGVIGTGASAIQIVPSIAGQVKQLTLFQRTPPWVLPRMDRGFSERTKTLFRTIPGLQRLFRGVIYAAMEMRALGFLGNRKLMQRVEKFARDYLEETIPDPALRKALTPDYQIGCKRILISDDYYQAFNRPNVSLVTASIDHATAQGIVTADGQPREFDTLIYATGFRANEPLAEINIVGRGGHTLAHDWRFGAEAYYGITVAGYPNFFILLGPNTGLGHNSIIFMIEAQVRYVMHCLGWLFREGAFEVEVRRNVQQEFNAKLKKDMDRTVWQSGCHSWYLNENGTNSTIWPGFTVSYWWRTRHPDPHDFVITAPEPAAALA
ncbi:MAG TPA: NAD(P)/FAD-dependent oxidoreductase [Rhizomicrobium sp.]|nr:NAD(P)/FAD-dependent oxidoreductase [Rhizomicrobium sp.]